MRNNRETARTVNFESTQYQMQPAIKTGCSGLGRNGLCSQAGYVYVAA
jgi:hypothetical protein